MGDIVAPLLSWVPCFGVAGLGARIATIPDQAIWRLNSGGTPNWFWGCHLA